MYINTKSITTKQIIKMSQTETVSDTILLLKKKEFMYDILAFNTYPLIDFSINFTLD